MSKGSLWYRFIISLAGKSFVNLLQKLESLIIIFLLNENKFLHNTHYLIR